MATTVTKPPSKADSIIAKISENEWKTFLAIADTFVPPVPVESLKPFASKNQYSATQEELTEFANTSPSTLGDKFLDHLKSTLALSPPHVDSKFAFILKLLSHRSTALIFTGSTSLLTEMSLAQREKVILSWYNARIIPLRELFRSFYILTHTTFIRVSPLGYKAMGHPEFDPYQYDSKRDTFTHDILDIGRYATSAEINVDVVIVGSGSGGGVIAHNLSKIKGLSILVIEKGKYYHESELNFNEDQGHANMYDAGLTIISDDGSITIAAGSTLGGGSTINWSASLKTPENIRKQWADSVPWYGEKVYDEAMDHVMEQMGCTTENLTHSFANSVILDGSAKLGYEAEVIPQNNGGTEHKGCGFCSYGCKHGGKQGSAINWLRVAAEQGNTKILTDTDVVRITREGAKATGVEAVTHQHGKDVPFRVNAKRVVVAGGSLQSPGLLLRSGFKNKHIGNNLKSHTISSIFGYFPDKELNAFEETILTGVCTETSDIDGRGHGSRVEGMLHQPLHTMGFYPWRSGEEWRQLQVKFNHLSALMIVHRDSGAGRVHYNADVPFRPLVDYTVNKPDLHGIVQGIATAADLLYIQGAQELIAPAPWIPTFVATVPVEKRTLSDPDYAAWVDNLRKTTFVPLKNNFISGHHMSSCRLGDDPSTSVGNLRGQLWESDNVYIADASAFPSGSGVNPMISVMATAHIISKFISEDIGI